MGIAEGKGASWLDKTLRLVSADRDSITRNKNSGPFSGIIPKRPGEKRGRAGVPGCG